MASVAAKGLKKRYILFHKNAYNFKSINVFQRFVPKLLVNKILILFLTFAHLYITREERLISVFRSWFNLVIFPYVSKNSCGGGETRNKLLVIIYFTVS